MIDLTKDQRILENRSVFYNCPGETFALEGTTFRTADSLTGKPVLYHTVLQNHAFITTGRDTADHLKQRADCLGRTLELDQLRDLFSLFEVKGGNPHYVFLKESAGPMPLAEGYALTSVDPGDHKTLQAFLDTCSAEDIDEALIDLDDPDEEIRLVFRGEQPVAYGGYRVLDGGLGDVGILVHRDHRKRGLGGAAVAAVTAACLKNGTLPFYRTCHTNLPSAAIAEKCGYELAWITTECRISF